MKNIIKQYFDKSRFLTMKNKTYAQTLIDLFDFQVKNDLIENDITSKIISGKYHDARALIISKQNGIVAGIEEVDYLIKNKTDLKTKIIIKDGQSVKEKELLLELFGNPLEILRYERTLLNILQRMSGIATMTHDIISKNRLKTALAATRKTLWGLIDKKAVAVGGGLTHRLSLNDEILIKDNHIDLLAKKLSVSRLESLKKILAFMKDSQTSRPFEIEVETEDEAYFVSQKNITAQVILMLDNFPASTAKKTIETIRKQKNGENIVFELSGGINEKNIHQFDEAVAGVISIGTLTNSSKSFDISLDLS